MLIETHSELIEADWSSIDAGLSLLDAKYVLLSLAAPYQALLGLQNPIKEKQSKNDTTVHMVKKNTSM